MAQATNTTLGEVVLGGDLGGDANLPELRASGVTPGTYPVIHRASVDSKGRITSIGEVTSAEVLALLSDASTTTKGVMRVGSNINVLDGVISLLNGDVSTKGIVQVGSNIDVSAGTISIADATTSSKGVVQVGSNISVTSGTISIADATTSSKGVVQVGSGVSVAAGTVFLANATDTSKGIARAGSGLSISSGTLSLDSLPDATTLAVGIAQVGSGFNVSSGIISVPDATTSSKGIVQIGSGLIDTSSVVSVPDATTSSKGIVQTGTGLTSTAGVLSLDTLPNATTSSKGIVQVGGNLSVSSGSISLATGSAATKGIVQVGSGFDVAAGVISVPDATTSSKGIVQVGSGLTVSGGVLAMADATTSSTGVVQIGGLLNVSAGVVSTQSVDATDLVKGFAQIGSGLAVSSGVVSADLPDATDTTKGIVQVGDGFTVSSGTISVQLASTSDFGVSQIASTGLSVSGGTVSGELTSTTVFGQMKPGANLSIAAGVLNLDIPDATTSSTGIVQLGSGFVLRSNDTVSLDSDVHYNGLNGKNRLSPSYNGVDTVGIDFVGFDKNVLQAGTVVQANSYADGSVTYQLEDNSSSQRFLTDQYIQLGANSFNKVVKVVSFSGYYYILVWNSSTSWSVWRGTNAYNIVKVLDFSAAPYTTGSPVRAGIAATSSAIVVTDASTFVKRSTNGTTWSDIYIDQGGLSEGFSCIAASTTRFCSISESGEYYIHSADGITWTFSSFTTGQNPEIHFANGRFIVASSTTTGTLYSTDGIVFDVGGTLPARTGYTAKRIFITNDGTNFWITSFEDVWSTSLNSVAYKSTDGVAWTQVTLPNPAGGFNNHPAGMSGVSGEISVVSGHPSNGYTLYYSTNAGSSWNTGDNASTLSSGTYYSTDLIGPIGSINLMFNTIVSSRRLKTSISGVISAADTTDYTASVYAPTTSPQTPGMIFDIIVDSATRNITLSFSGAEFSVHPSTTLTVTSGTKAYYTVIGYSTTGSTTLTDKWLVMPRTM